MSLASQTPPADRGGFIKGFALSLVVVGLILAAGLLGIRAFEVARSRKAVVSTAPEDRDSQRASRIALLKGKFANFTLPRLLPDRMLDRMVGKRLGLLK